MHLPTLDVFAANTRNAYLQAPLSQKDFIICGEEFGLENVGKVVLIHRALYGGKKDGSYFGDHYRSCMRHLYFTSCLADPDLWMRLSKKTDSTSYYKYILFYTDDALVISQHAEETLKELGRYFELKEESIGTPKIYLGGHCIKVQLYNGVKTWAFSSSQYVQSAVKNVEEYVKDKENLNIPGRAETPMQTYYRPKLDGSMELTPERVSYYM